MEKLALELHAIGAVQFGNFTLKSGMISPVYFDLRLLVSYPLFLRQIALQLFKKTAHCRYNCICGVPYTALPIAAALSLHSNIPMVMRRKEAKEYGTKKMIEGVFRAEDSCLVIEDLITTGSSIFETIDPLEKEGLKVKDIAVILDREQGGKEKLEAKGYKVHSLLGMSELLANLENNGRIKPEMAHSVKTFITSNQC